MKLALFDTHPFERTIFEKSNAELSAPHEITFFELRLQRQTLPLAFAYPALCIFVNDRMDASMISELADRGLKLLALRSAGFNHVDLAACRAAGVTVVRVPAYSPHAVAEHALCLLLALNRKVHRAYQRVKELNFSLEGLVGFDLNGKTVGVVGTGKIGFLFAKFMRCLGCRVLASDLVHDKALEDLGVEYTALDTIFRHSDVISLHVPLTDSTKHMIDEAAIAKMKDGIFVINTGRGGLVDTHALITGLKSGKIGAAGLDVYEEEEGVFFLDLSSSILQDDTLARLLAFPNVLVTSHQGFLTKEALTNIAVTTLANITAFESSRPLTNSVSSSGTEAPVTSDAPKGVETLE